MAKSVSTQTDSHGHNIHSPGHEEHAAAPETIGGMSKWTRAWLLAVLVMLISFLLARGCSPGMSSNSEVVEDSSSAATATPPPAGSGPESISVKLPDGAELDANKGGIEDRLVAYLNSTDAADSISNSRWFDFDNLNFKTGSAEITDSSRKQVQNLAAILRAYPKASIKIGGYTDKTGSEEENLKLSQRRADAVLDAIKKAGATDTQLVSAKGYGSQYAKADASASDEQRKPDRRISVSVRSK